MKKKANNQIIADNPWRVMVFSTWYFLYKILQNDHLFSQYLSVHESLYDSFEVISIDGNVSTYLDKEAMVIQNDTQNLFHRMIIHQINKIN